MKRFVLCSSLIIFVAFTAFVPPAAAQDPVVRAILFYLPTCPHCHIVMTEHLPVILEIFNTQIEWVYLPTDEPLEPDAVPPVIMAMGDRLQILYVDASTAVGGEIQSGGITSNAINRNLCYKVLLHCQESFDAMSF